MNDFATFYMLQFIPLHTHTRLTALCPGLPGWAGTRKVKPIWILLKQETVSDSEIRWAICKSAPCSRQITTPAPHRSVFYRPDALPAAQPTASKHCMRRKIPQHKTQVDFLAFAINITITASLGIRLNVTAYIWAQSLNHIPAGCSLVIVGFL